MALSDMTGWFVLVAVLAGFLFLLYRDTKNPKPLGNFQNLHTLTQGVNLLDVNVERDNQALNSATKHNLDDSSFNEK